MPTAPIIKAPTQHAKITSTISPADMAVTTVETIVAVSRRAPLRCVRVDEKRVF